ncbi:hypothetical protein C5167_008129, partial [Papaver somniferum]
DFYTAPWILGNDRVWSAKVKLTAKRVLKLAKALSTSFPTFHNLIRLEVYVIRYLQMKTLLNFLEFSPNLEALIINKVKFSGKVSENALTFGKVPRCLECLKSFEIQQFNGCWRWLNLFWSMQEFFKPSSWKLYISWKDDYMDPRKNKKNLDATEVEALNKKILMQLEMSPWGSTGCVIKFSSF